MKGSSNLDVGFLVMISKHAWKERNATWNHVSDNNYYRLQ